MVEPKADALAKRHFGQDTPSVADLGRNVSIVITNRNQALGAKAIVPAMILVDMLHIKEPKPLPKVSSMILCIILAHIHIILLLISHKWSFVYTL